MLDMFTSATTSGCDRARISMSCQSCHHSTWVLLGDTIDVILTMTIQLVVHSITKRFAMFNQFHNG